MNLPSRRGEASENGGRSICPRSGPPARTLYAIRAGDLTSFSRDLRLTLSCLLGLGNRRQPRLNLVHDRAMRREAEYSEITEVRCRTPLRRPAFVYAFLANWFPTMDMGENLLRGLGPAYIPVRTDQVAALYRESLA